MAVQIVITPTDLNKGFSVNGTTPTKVDVLLDSSLKFVGNAIAVDYSAPAFSTGLCAALAALPANGAVGAATQLVGADCKTYTVPAAPAYIKCDGSALTVTDKIMTQGDGASVAAGAVDGTHRVTVTVAANTTDLCKPVYTVQADYDLAAALTALPAAASITAPDKFVLGNSTTVTFSQVQAAILAAVPADVFLASGAYNPATNILALTLSNGTVINVDMTTLLSDVLSLIVKCDNSAFDYTTDKIVTCAALPGLLATSTTNTLTYVTATGVLTSTINGVAATATIPPGGPSADAGNLITAGTDGKPFINAATITAQETVWAGTSPDSSITITAGGTHGHAPQLVVNQVALRGNEVQDLGGNHLGYLLP